MVFTMDFTVVSKTLPTLVPSTVRIRPPVLEHTYMPFYMPRFLFEKHL